MTINFTRSPGSATYTSAFHAMLPGLLIGFMFLAVAFASKSAADSEQRSIERSLTARTATPEDLREEISLQTGVMGVTPIKTNLTTATETGLRKLYNPEAAAALERVAIEIDLPQSNEADRASNRLPLELLELLSRRSSPLQIEITLRVAPARAGIAMRWFDSVRRNAKTHQIVDLSQIAVRLDKNMPIDKLRLDILRTKTMVMIKESQL